MCSFLFFYFYHLSPVCSLKTIRSYRSPSEILQWPPSGLGVGVQTSLTKLSMTYSGIYPPQTTTDTLGICFYREVLTRSAWKGAASYLLFSLLFLTELGNPEMPTHPSKLCFLHSLPLPWVPTTCPFFPVF